jgi:hypothetical protein
MVMALVVISATAPALAQQPSQPPPAKGTRIYQTDQYGKVRHDQPSWVVKENGRIVEVSPYGHEQSHKQQYKVEGDRVYQADFAGRIQYNKPSYSVEKDGRVIQQSPYGHPQYDAPQFIVEGSKVYAADKYGRPKQPAFQVESKAASKK